MALGHMPIHGEDEPPPPHPGTNVPESANFFLIILPKYKTLPYGLQDLRRERRCPAM